MESGVPVRINPDAQQAVPLAPGHADDPLSEFPQESRKVNEESADRVVPRKDAIRAGGIVSHLKRALRTLNLVRDLAETVDGRFAALKNLDQEIQHRAGDLESLKEGILNGTGQAEHVARLFMSLEPRLVALTEQEQRLRAVETTVAALENRARTVTTQLERLVGACEAREGLVGHAVEQLGRRAADTINELETRVDDCEARARTANETIAHLHDVATRTLPELQQRLKEADDKNDLVDQRIAGAARVATSLTALEQRLPEIARCEQELARIERVVPQVERQLGNLDAGVEQQIRALTVNQHRAEQTLDEAQRTDTLVSGLEHRLADLSQSHLQLDTVDMRLGQLEQRAARAATEFEQTSRDRNRLEQEVVALQNHVRQLTETTEGETKKLVELTELAERDQQEHSRRASSVLSGLETRMADVRRGHQLVDQVEQQLRQLEFRAAAAVAGLEQASHAKTDLDREIVELQNQLRRLTASADEGVKRLVEIKQQADPRALRPRRSLSLTRRVFGGIAVGLSVTVVALLGSVWRFSRPEDVKGINPPPLPLLASRALTFEPNMAAVPLTAAPIVGSPQLSSDDRQAAAPRPTRTAQGVSGTVGKASRSEPVGVPKQSVGTAGGLPQFSGTLVIESEPAGATAFVNGQPVGKTPVVLKDVRVGSCVVRMEYEGYQRWSTAVSVSTTRETRVTAALARDERE